jgi:hypothetical protein
MVKAGEAEIGSVIRPGAGAARKHSAALLRQFLGRQFPQLVVD